MVTNRFNVQPAKFRIHALHFTDSYDGTSILLTDFSGAFVGFTLYISGGGCNYTATDSGASPVGARANASKSFLRH